MSPELIGLLSIVVLVILIFFRVWIAVAMGIVGFLGFALVTDFRAATMIMGSIPYSTVADEGMGAIPLFILMGTIVGHTGLGTELYETAHKWIGHLKGGLAMATVIASGAFAAISGNSTASVAIMGRMALPEMRKYNYDRKLAAGAIAAGGTIGILIPPSMGFILYGILTEQSIGKLFMAGIIPGILEVAFYIGTVFIICRINPMAGPAGKNAPFKDKVVSLKNTWSMILLFVLVMGGIYGGWFTPTEAGAVGAFGAILIAGIARKLNVKNVYSAVLEAAQTTAMIVLLVVSAFVLTKLMAVSRLPDFLAHTIVSFNVPPAVILLLIISLYIILGMFLDIFAAILLTLPILYPVVISIGFDPIWYGVIMVRVMEVGLITPPMGLNVFIMASVTDEEIGTIFRGVVPFVLADVAHITLLVFIPSLSLFLPSLM